jgi:hypothetical protein
LIAQKAGHDELLDELIEKFSGSDLNSFLLELLRKRVKKITAAELLREFEKNRFAVPSTVDSIDFKELELRCLKLAESKNFRLVTLSPLTVLGTCSVTGFVDQNNVVSALRGTEVVSDVTNVFALMIATEFKRKKNNSVLKFATTHRHVRSQALSNPAFTAHFGLFGMASGGIDTGSYSFEIDNLSEHIDVHASLLSKEFPNGKLLLKIYMKTDNEIFRDKLQQHLMSRHCAIQIIFENRGDPGDYYNLVRFRFFLLHNGEEINLSDGGFVDWTQKLIQNKKHRLLISGVGIELIHKIQEGKL